MILSCKKSLWIFRAADNLKVLNPYIFFSGPNMSQGGQQLGLKICFTLTNHLVVQNHIWTFTVRVDLQVGLVLAKLEKVHLLRNKVLIFLEMSVNNVV